MTPQEICEYKQRWMPGYPVRLHSDLRSRGKDWCKKLDKWEWNFKQYTNNYEDTYYFENIYASQNFEMEHSRWVIRDDAD